jgi:hypothetical protein
MVVCLPRAPRVVWAQRLEASGVWVSGRKTRKEAPPPGRSWTQARPPWRLANWATRAQADAGAGGVVGEVASLVEGLKDSLAELGRYTGSLVFDQQQDAVVPLRVNLS